MKTKREHIAILICCVFLLTGIILSCILFVSHVLPQKISMDQVNICENGYDYSVHITEDSKGYVILDGFCQKKNEKIVLIDIHGVLVDQKEETIYILPSKWYAREEVTPEMMENDADYDKSGWKSRVFKQYFNSGETYKIGILYRTNENNDLIITDGEISF